MTRDELVRQLVMLPSDADVVVDLGRIEVDIVEVVGLTFPGERNNIALKPHPDDLRDAMFARECAADRIRVATDGRGDPGSKKS